jgi:hypothetical protein
MTGDNQWMPVRPHYAPHSPCCPRFTDASSQLAIGKNRTPVHLSALDQNLRLEFRSTTHVEWDACQANGLTAGKFRNLLTSLPHLQAARCDDFAINTIDRPQQVTRSSTVLKVGQTILLPSQKNWAQVRVEKLALQHPGHDLLPLPGLPPAFQQHGLAINAPPGVFPAVRVNDVHLRTYFPPCDPHQNGCCPVFRA